MMAAGNKKGADSLDDKKIALLSPQFMSILPDEVANDTVRGFMRENGRKKKIREIGVQKLKVQF